MNNKKFLYGVVVGILGCNICHSLIKDRLHPIAVKIVRGALVAKDTTKSFAEEVNEKAMEHRKERFRRVAESLEPTLSNRNNQISANIDELKKQLNELKDKIK